MANRFTAIGFSTKHIDERGSFHFGYALIRPADHGITDDEFEFGVRVIQADVASFRQLTIDLDDQCYEIVADDHWKELITPQDYIANNNWSYPTKADKWDPVREIY